MPRPGCMSGAGNQSRQMRLDANSSTRKQNVQNTVVFASPSIIPKKIDLRPELYSSMTFCNAEIQRRVASIAPVPQATQTVFPAQCQPCQKLQTEIFKVNIFLLLNSSPSQSNNSYHRPHTSIPTVFDTCVAINFQCPLYMSKRTVHFYFATVF